MNYNKLTDLQEQHKVSDRRMAKYVGMTGVGYRKMIDKKTCTVEALEKISHHFNKSISYFFEEELNELNEPKAEYKNNCCELCKEKDKQIEDLRSNIADLRSDKEWLQSQIAKKETGASNSVQFRQAANE